MPRRCRHLLLRCRLPNRPDGRPPRRRAVGPSRQRAGGSPNTPGIPRARRTMTVVMTQSWCPAGSRSRSLAVPGDSAEVGDASAGRPNAARRTARSHRRKSEPRWWQVKPGRVATPARNPEHRGANCRRISPPADGCGRRGLPEARDSRADSATENNWLAIDARRHATTNSPAGVGGLRLRRRPSRRPSTQ